MVTTIRGKTRGNRRAMIGKLLIGLSVIALPAICIPVLAPVHGQRAATTQPSTELQEWVNQLADGDSLVREKARENLMGLKSQDLTMLHAAVAKVSDRLLPSQKIYLREIVRQVFLSGLAYPVDDPPTPFLGVRWNSAEAAMSFVAAAAAQMPAPTTGLMVETRVPGFEAFRMLRDGDLVLGIDGVAEDQTFGQNEFALVMKQHFRTGEVVTLRVARNGQILHVPIRLSARPSDLPQNANDISFWIDPRDEEADAYWKRNFQPIVKDDGPLLSSGGP